MSININKLLAIGETKTPSYKDSIKKGDIVIQDDSDGKGPYIKLWNHLDVKPTEEDVNTFDDLPYYKSKKIIELKEKGLEYGLKMWPLHEQMDANTDNNSSIGTKAELILFRVNMRKEWTVIKNAITAANSKTEVDAVTLNWPTN